jgi:hypothetical protein
LKGKIAVVVTVACAVAAPATAKTPLMFTNCKALNHRYPHGVGRVGARDRTKSGDPVTNFTRNTRVYKLAMHYNLRLDADKDGVACEKH